MHRKSLLVALAQQDAAPMQQGSSEVSAAKSVDAVSSQHPRLTQSMLKTRY